MSLAWAFLAVLAVALAWPVPIALARASWTARAPGTALALWQAIALAGGLSMIGALLSYGLIPFGDDLVTAFEALAGKLFSGPLPPTVGVTHIVALSGALLLGIHLLLNLANTAVRTERQRRRHHALVELLSSPIPDRPGTRLLDHPAPVAYCLPGVRTITVLSEGLVQLLDAQQLRAVLAHERAHLRQFHHLVLLAFKAWHSALPWFPIANRAEKAVALLVEMLADDDARQEVDDETLATAIALVGSSWREAPGDDDETPSATDADALGARLSRLITPTPPLPRPARLLVLAGGAVLVLVPAVFILLLL
ncbi:M56 family metallopeptidase [Compostimonas suwonensis]|uniref:Peptidase M48-like protein n=1 Tax=Compostimonas suwonensis TaxID=1048394 RepID=A0A2M9BZ80_9MICO|nr:M56 family metallopeptidase [Compostimonas suwonensis]PJJ63384.1 peptidase M48-like protein [Compostimonas suwonensis]